MKFNGEEKENIEEVQGLTKEQEKLIQAELDMAEEYVIKCLFGSADLKQIQMRVSMPIKLFLKSKNKTLLQVLNCKIAEFEAIMRPCMLPNGMVDVDFAVEALCHFMEWCDAAMPMPVKEIRLVDFCRRFDKPLHHLGRHIQGLEQVPHKQHNPY